MQSMFSGQGCKVALVKTEGLYVIEYNGHWKKGNIAEETFSKTLSQELQNLVHMLLHQSEL